MENERLGARPPVAGESQPVPRPAHTPPPPPVGGRPVANPPNNVERRRSGWGEFRRAYPGIIATMGLAFTIMVASDAWLLYKRSHYTGEVDRLRSGMTDAERKQADGVIAAEQNKFRVMVELVRRQAQGDKDLHLSIEVDSARMMLEREGALLREMPVEVAPAKVIGTGPDTVRMAPPRGARTVEKVLEGGDWEIPKWVYTDRGLPVETDRTIKGALGPIAILLSGGTVIYAQPTSGPLADPNYLLPGSIRARTSDLKAIAPNLKAGSTVYFY
jgi:hypothetical protein